MDKKVYLQAAKDISNPKHGSIYCCPTICNLTNWVFNCIEIRVLSSYFKPEYEDGGENGWFGDVDKQENQEHRVTALLLMHEIAKDL